MAAARAEQPRRASGCPTIPGCATWTRRPPRSSARLRATLFDPTKQPNAQIAEQVDDRGHHRPRRRARRPRAAPGDARRPDQPHALPGGRAAGGPARGCDPGTGAIRRSGPPHGPARGAQRPDHARRRGPLPLPRAARAAARGPRAGAATASRTCADAVPGWFQATLALYDAQGNEVAYADDYRFDPDPVLLYEVPEDGEYGLEIRDAIYRGREDFVYRITVGELPFVTSIFPLGGHAGTPPRRASVSGLEPARRDAASWTRSPAGAHPPAAGSAGRPGLRTSCRTPWTPAREPSRPSPTTPPAAAQQVALPADRQRPHRAARRRGRVSLRRPSRRGGGGRGLRAPAELAAGFGAAAGRTRQGTRSPANDDHDDPEAGPDHPPGRLVPARQAAGRWRLPAWYLSRRPAGRAARRTPTACTSGPPQPDFALRVTPSSLSMPPDGRRRSRSTRCARTASTATSTSR